MKHAILVFVAGCSGGAAAAAPDAGPPDGAANPSGDGKDEACADSFGTALTNAFGRLDGTVVAVVEPGNTRCALPNGDHVIVQVAMAGAVYRMVVNVQSDNTADPDIRVHEVDAPLPAPGFAEGWHTGLGLDYAADLAVRSTDAWDTLPLADASARVADAITIGAPIAIYATSSGGAHGDSAHLIHREGGNADGAIVIDPTGAPRWLLFRFSDQTF